MNNEYNGLLIFAKLQYINLRDIKQAKVFFYWILKIFNVIKLKNKIWQ